VMDILDPEGFKEPAQALYRDLIAPIAPSLKARTIGSLAFIVDEGLRGLPLAALYDGKQFLVENYSLALLPSLGLSNTRYAAIGQAQLLAMGASEFPPSAGQAPLPAAAAELDVISRQLWNGRSFLNQEFTRDRLKGERKASPFGILHLATHADFKPGKLADSYIQLWDSRLTMDKVRDLGWNSPPLKLLVLSACKTAIGDRQSELGFAGLAAQTGVKSALASLWYVSDQGTLALMSEFYSQLKPAPFKAEALRQAQLAMVQNKLTIENDGIKLADGRRLQIPEGVLEPGSVDLTHPYYWSAFTLVGSPW
jgi:CHAT domain-containing protein